MTTKQMKTHHPSYYEIERLLILLVTYLGQWDDYAATGRKFAYHALQKHLTEAKKQG